MEYNYRFTSSDVWIADRERTKATTKARKTHKQFISGNSRRILQFTIFIYFANYGLVSAAPDRLVIALAITLSLAFFLTFLVVQRFNRWKLVANTATNAKKCEEKTLSISPEYVVSKWDDVYTRYSWKQFGAIFSTESYVHFPVSAGGFISVPISEIESYLDVDNFIAQANGNISVTLNSQNSNELHAIDPATWPPSPSQQIGMSSLPDYSSELNIPYVGPSLDHSNTIILSNEFMSFEFILLMILVGFPSFINMTFSIKLLPMSFACLCIPRFAEPSFIGFFKGILIAFLFLFGVGLGSSIYAAIKFPGPLIKAHKHMKVSTDFIRLVMESNNSCVNVACDRLAAVQWFPFGVVISYWYGGAVILPITSFESRAAAYSAFQRLKAVSCSAAGSSNVQASEGN